MSEESNVKQRKQSKGYKNTNCVAHNSRGYDSRFVLKYLDSKSLVPETIGANGGSSIQRIAIKGRRIVWIDSLNCVNQPFSHRPKTYGLKNTVKGLFPTWLEYDVLPILHRNYPGYQVLSSPYTHGYLSTRTS